ncbi:MAG: hypothetical protein V7K54_19355 [Nostoc sp.]
MVRDVLPVVGNGGSDVPYNTSKLRVADAPEGAVTRKNGRVKRHKGASTVVLALASHLASAVAIY